MANRHTKTVVHSTQCFNWNSGGLVLGVRRLFVRSSIIGNWQNKKKTEMFGIETILVTSS